MDKFASDHELEKFRYETSARRELASKILGKYGSQSIVESLREPYTKYEKSINGILTQGMNVIEFGAGTGLHSMILASNNANVTCIDVAPTALSVLEKRFSQQGLKVRTIVSKMEQTPFEDSMFDLAVSAGSLSYASIDQFDKELHRILRPRGCLICVDSLKSNPIYSLNRWINWKVRNSRSKSMIENVPTNARLSALRAMFEQSEIQYFGSFAWSVAPLAKIFGQRFGFYANQWCDRLPGLRFTAFKFVLSAQGLKK